MASTRSTRLSASCSEPVRIGSRRAAALAGAVLAVVTAALPTEALAKVFLTREQGLEKAFGDAEIRRESSFLTDEQVEDARRRAGGGVEIRGALVARYVAQRGGRRVGTAYLDTHRVRTLDQTVLVVLDANGAVSSVEILSFAEPAEYLPRAGWLDQFQGRGLDEDLALKRGIHGITGATLSSRAVTDAVRRVLALHEVIESGPRAGGPGQP